MIVSDEKGMSFLAKYLPDHCLASSLVLRVCAAPVQGMEPHEDVTVPELDMSATGGAYDPAQDMTGFGEEVGMEDDAAQEEEMSGDISGELEEALGAAGIKAESTSHMISAGGVVSTFKNADERKQRLERDQAKRFIEETRREAVAARASVADAEERVRKAQARMREHQVEVEEMTARLHEEIDGARADDSLFVCGTTAVCCATAALCRDSSAHTPPHARGTKGKEKGT